MAIAFASVSIVSAGSGSAVGLSAYMTRENRADEQTAKVAPDATSNYTFGWKDADLAAKGVALPEGAPEHLRHGGNLWNQALAAETTVDRTTKVARFKKGAQVAKHIVVALPKEADDATREAMTRQFVAEKFTAKGVAVEWAIHRPHDGGINHHAHLLVSTRYVNEKGFGKKARELNPDFASKNGRSYVAEQDRWGEQWATFQNQYFYENGIDLTVDPTKSIAERHVGPERTHATEEPAATAARKAQTANDNVKKTALEYFREDPAEILDEAGRWNATFTARDIDRVLKVHGIEGAERDDLRERALRSRAALALFDSQGRETGRYTTREIRAQEIRTHNNFAKIQSGAHAINKEAAGRVLAPLRLSPEQFEAVQYALDQRQGLALIEGRAGTGKSHVLKGLRAAYEASGYRVVGLAPTNTVVKDMREAGFSEARTAHSAAWRLDHGKDTWNWRTVVVVDEAAMLDAERFDRIAAEAAKAGARVVLAGDDRQLSSVQRGGTFAELKRRAGAVEISTVRRQQVDWQRAASEAFSRGDFKAGLTAYEAQGHLRWSQTVEDAQDALKREYRRRVHEAPEKARFVYASTNAQVNQLNAELRQVHVAAGRVDPTGEWVSSKRGEIQVGAGDRVQFYETDKALGVLNGELGTVAQARDGHISVIKDSGERVSFHSGVFQGFGHGYAGTVYRGQGKTQPEVMALYDHEFAWKSETAYVALTRHQERVDLFAARDLAPDTETLARKMSRTTENGASLQWEARPVPAPELEPEPEPVVEQDVDPRTFYRSYRPEDDPALEPDREHGPEAAMWREWEAEAAREQELLQEQLEREWLTPPSERGYDDDEAEAARNHPEPPQPPQERHERHAEAEEEAAIQAVRATLTPRDKLHLRAIASAQADANEREWVSNRADAALKSLVSEYPDAETLWPRLLEEFEGDSPRAFIVNNLVEELHEPALEAVYAYTVAQQYGEVPGRLVAQAEDESPGFTERTSEAARILGVSEQDFGTLDAVSTERSHGPEQTQGPDHGPTPDYGMDMD